MALDIPLFVMGSFDPCAHKTQTDICHLVEHEIALYREGEESDITNKKECNQAVQFLNKHKATDSANR